MLAGGVSGCGGLQEVSSGFVLQSTRGIMEGAVGHLPLASGTERSGHCVWSG